MRFFLPLLLLALGAAPAAAQRNAYQAEGEVTRLLQDARSYYDNLELEQTEEALARAVGLIEQYRLSGRVVADVYIQRGILYHVRDQDERATLADFTQALSNDPSAQLDSMVSTPSLKRIFDQARSQARPRARPPVRRDPPLDRYRPPPARDPGFGRGQPAGTGINHQPPRSARGGEPVDLAVDISDPQVNRNVFRVWVYFRSARAATVQKREMRPQGPSLFTTRIPGRFVAGRQLTYYIAMEDRTGRIIATVRSAKDPVMVPVRGGALAGMDEIPSGDSLLGDSGGGWGGGDAGYSRVTLSLSLGTGGGFITDRAKPVTLEDKRISPGFALAPFHTMVELDFWPHERFGISAFGRIQIVEFAHLEGGRLKFRAVNTDAHDLILRGGGGFGRIRHLVDLGVGLDTTLEGPYMYTLGLTYEFKISRRFQFLVTPDFLHMIGDSPSTHFDLNLGIQVGF